MKESRVVGENRIYPQIPYDFFPIGIYGCDPQQVPCGNGCFRERDPVPEKESLSLIQGMRGIFLDQRFHIFGRLPVIAGRVRPVPVIEQFPVPVIQPENDGSPFRVSQGLPDQLLPAGLHQCFRDCLKLFCL